MAAIGGSCSVLLTLKVTKRPPVMMCASYYMSNNHISVVGGRREGASCFWWRHLGADYSHQKSMTYTRDRSLITGEEGRGLQNGKLWV